MTPRESKIREILDELVRQRQAMHQSAADAVLVEANRLAIAYWQRQLSPAQDDEQLRRRRPPGRVDQADENALRSDSSH